MVINQPSEGVSVNSTIGPMSRARPAYMLAGDRLVYRTESYIQDVLTTGDHGHPWSLVRSPTIVQFALATASIGHAVYHTQWPVKGYSVTVT